MALTNNDTLRRLRYALRYDDATMVELLALGGETCDLDVMRGLLKKEGDPAYLPCSDLILGAFLDGLILKKRGPRPGTPDPETNAPRSAMVELSNNDVLKKLRIALELKEEDLVGIMARAGVRVSPSEFGALFRQRGHRNFKACGDQFLRNFLTGLEGWSKN